MAQYRFEKLFSPQEANELIPTLEGLMRALQLQVSDLRERIRKIVNLDRDADSLPLARIIDLHPELKPAAARMGELAQQVESLGCFLKDIDQGLVDFPAEVDDGDVVFLCWQFGEPSVLAWHPVEGGFAERKPLPGARKQYLNTPIERPYDQPGPTCHMVIALFIYLLCIVCWLGGMLFFSIFTAPVVFSQLPISEAGKVVAGIFPRYYILGYVAGIISFILALYFTMAHSPRLWWSLAAIALLIALALTFYAGAVVRPKVDAIRTVAEEQNPDAARKAEFQQLHRLSVSLNGAVMVLNVLALLSTAAALAPHA